MESQDLRKNSPSGNGEGHGVHVCHKCGWPFPNARPSAKHRKAHKRVCGTIEGYKAHLDGSDDEHLSDNDSKSLSSETVEKAAFMTVSSRSFSGIGSGSNRSTRSEEDVFSDAVTDFVDALGVSDSDDVREPDKKREISLDDRFAKVVADAGDSDTQYYLQTATMSSSSHSGLAAREDESKKGVLFEKSKDIETVPTENAGMTSEAVFEPPKVIGDSLDFVPEDAAMEVIGKESDTFDEKVDSFPKDSFDAQMNGLDDSSEAVNMKADGLTLGGHSKVLPEKLPSVVTLDPAQEVAVTQGTLAEPSESENKNSKDIISEVLHQEDNSEDEVCVEMNSEKIHTNAIDDDISEPSRVVIHLDKDINEAGQGKVVTDEQNPLVFADTNLQRVLENIDIHTHSKPDHDDLEHDNEEAEFSDAIEADGPKVAEEELSIVPEFEDRVDDKVDVERNYVYVLEASTSEPSKASLLQCDTETKNLQDSEVAVKDLGSPSEEMVIGKSVGAVVLSDISSVGDNVDVAELTHDENCVQKASDSVDVSLTKKVKENDVQLEKTEISAAQELENDGHKISGQEGVRKVDIGLLSENEDESDFTQYAVAANGFNTADHAEAVSSVEDRYTKERDVTSSAFTDSDRKLVKQEEAVSELDIQADLISQTDSLEGNWGSVSVLSTLSDAPAATDAGSQPSQESAKGETANLQPKSNNGESDIFQPPSYMLSVEQKADGSDQNEVEPEAQTSLKPQEHGVQFPPLAPAANESSGRKRNEEIIAKVTNWSTGKQHLSLKSYLVESESSPSAKDNPHPPVSQETKNTVMGNKEPEDDAARKEWNSPARYPANIKREKGKAKTRPLWATFICCSSVQTS